MSTLTPTQTKALQDSLRQREQQLLQEIQSARAEKEQHVQDAEDFAPEPDANQSRANSDLEVRHAELLRDQQELQDVRAALQRVAEGEYGECIDCGKGIALARLQAFPTAKRCIDCQTQHEAQKRRLA